MSYTQQTAPITKLTIDLTTARVGVNIMPPGLAIRQVYVATLPAGADFNLKEGPANPGTPMVQTGSLVFFNALTDGLYLDNTAQPGLTAILSIRMGSKDAP